jgi:hypothetical protein
VNKILSGRFRPDNITKGGIIHKSENYAKESEIHRTFRLFGGFAWYTMSINHLGKNAILKFMNDIHDSRWCDRHIAELLEVLEDVVTPLGGVSRLNGQPLSNLLMPS